MHRTAIIILSALLFGCAQPIAPNDSSGKTPDVVLMDAYKFIIDGDFEAAEKIFDPRLIKATLPPTNPDTFQSFYQKQTADWTVDVIETQSKGNDYNPNVWRVRIGPTDGRPGAVHDLAILDGVWRIVYWGDFPKG